MSVLDVDQKSLLEAWSGPVWDPSLVRDELLHEVFETTVDAHGDRLAVVIGETRLTYRELDERSNRLARLLRERGVTRGAYVGLLLPRGPDVYVTLLGILKAGAAYVMKGEALPARSSWQGSPARLVSGHPQGARGR